MIVGTAGHIDHGKTTLVRALTGVDTDRLPEEKKRGITIELGYAFLDPPGGLGGERIGFIDVPGHERLVHTMLAGATGIDFGLLLVAADDGVMPQTREHLAVLSLLGLQRGAIALTKTDRVGPARIEAVRADVQTLLAQTPLAGAPVLPVCALSGQGVDALRDVLVAAARGSVAHEASDAAFRLAIDRVFTLDGVGTVVTGTVHAGSVRIGDDVALLPSHGARRARVRSLHAQNRAVDRAQAGQRCAVALPSLAKSEIARGQWLVAPDIALATSRLDADLHLWHAEAKPLRSGTPVHVHLGASDTIATVAVLASADAAGGDSLSPGSRGRVQLVLHAPIGAWRGDRVVLRDASAGRTIAGGVVLDPFAPARYRRTPQRLAELAAWSQATAPQRLEALLAATPHGIDLRRWAIAEGRLDSQAAAPLPERVLQAGAWVLSGENATVWRAALMAALRDFHARAPEELGPELARLRRLAAPRLSEALWHALVMRLRAEGAIASRGAFVHLPEHGLRLSVTDERLAQKLAPRLEAAGLEGAWVRTLARDARESEALVRTTLARLAQRGELFQVVQDLYYPPQAMQRLARTVRTLAAQRDGAVGAAGFRDATGLGRKRAIQVLEYFDRVGLLRRFGDVHRLRGASGLFMEN